MGFSPSWIANARRDPQLRSALQQQIASNPPQSRVRDSYLTRPSSIEDEVAAVQRQSEVERRRPLHNPPPRSRVGSILSLNDQRDSAVAAKERGDTVVVTSYTCLPKAFSTAALADLQPSLSLSASSPS
jgi:hypothetical protein